MLPSSIAFESKSKIIVEICAQVFLAFVRLGGGCDESYVSEKHRAVRFELSAHRTLLMPAEVFLFSVNQKVRHRNTMQDCFTGICTRTQGPVSQP